MEEIERFTKKIKSDIDQCNEGKVILLSFLDETQKAIVNKCLFGHNNYINCYFYGGFTNSERVRCLLTHYESNNNKLFKINIYKIIYNKKYYELNHRSILGALMGLGIKRECIGDIILTPEKDAFFACTEEISKYIESELNYVGNAPVKINLYSDKIEHEIKYEETMHFLSSMRLDVVVAAIIGLSRSNTLELISSKLVFVNGLETENSSQIIKENDEISVRHKGKYKIIEVGSQTKSGRIKVTIGKRI